MSLSKSGLKTRTIFIDTQTYRQFNFDWEQGVLLSLAKLGYAQTFELLTTTVTVQEIKSQLQELLANTRTSVARNGAVMRQLTGCEFSAVHGENAVTVLSEKVDQFAKYAKIKMVPTSTNVEAILEQYFKKQPPFSAKKKSEFPDAIIVASLREWAAVNNRKIYIVSADQDMVDCCSEDGPLISVTALAELINAVTITEEIHQALYAAVSGSGELKERIKKGIWNAFGVPASTWYGTKEGSIVGVKLADVGKIDITKLDVYSRDGERFGCYVQFKTDLKIDVQLEGSATGSQGFKFSAWQGSQSDLHVIYEPGKPDSFKIERFFLGEYTSDFQDLYRRRRDVVFVPAA